MPLLSIENLARYDLTDFDDRPEIRALLLPLSASAAHSVNLPENKAKVAQVAPRKTSPSPSNSRSKDNIHPTSNTEAKNETQKIIFLEQLPAHEKFNFVSSSDFREQEASNVVLKHPDPGDPSVCYINRTHLELYPDPDRGALVLYNKSTSDFKARSLLARQAINITSRHQATLDEDTWQLMLGDGLEFELKILPHTPRDFGHHRLHPSPTELCKGDIQRARTIERSGKTNRTRERAKSPQVIAETAFTTVFLINDLDAVFAVKRCRQPDPIHTAVTWKNELDILRRLHHPSIVTLSDFNASDPSLKFEYIGPDLAQFANKEHMSQFSQDEQHRIWMDSARGLKYIHDEGVAHLDVKPQNILYDRHGLRAVICDFGISAKIYNGSEVFHGGTPCYVPPEYLLNQPRGYSSGIWALGVTMLFVFRLIPLPRLHWKIADVNHDVDVRRKMKAWVDTINAVVTLLPENLLPLRKMLIADAKERITAASLVEQLPSLRTRGRNQALCLRT